MCALFTPRELVVRTHGGEELTTSPELVAELRKLTMGGEDSDMQGLLNAWSGDSPDTWYGHWCRFFTAHVGEEVVGWSAVYRPVDDVRHLVNAFVREDVRGQGIGRRLGRLALGACPSGAPVIANSCEFWRTLMPGSVEYRKTRRLVLLRYIAP